RSKVKYEFQKTKRFCSVSYKAIGTFLIRLITDERGLRRKCEFALVRSSELHGTLRKTCSAEAQQQPRADTRIPSWQVEFKEKSFYTTYEVAAACAGKGQLEIATTCVLLSLAASAFAGYIGPSHGLGYGTSHFGVSRGIGYSTVTGFAHSIGYAEPHGYSLLSRSPAHVATVPLVTAHAVPSVSSVVIPPSVTTVTTTIHHSVPVATVAAVPVTTTYHSPVVATGINVAPVYGNSIGNLGYGTGHYGYGHGLVPHSPSPAKVGLWAPPRRHGVAVATFTATDFVISPTSNLFYIAYSREIKCYLVLLLKTTV
ncbi:hypothetical protein V5799_010539, partial [Amblyomma americanum]